jgi:hypothetical protein
VDLILFENMKIASGANAVELPFDDLIRKKKVYFPMLMTEIPNHNI